MVSMANSPPRSTQNLRSLRQIPHCAISRNLLRRACCFAALKVVGAQVIGWHHKRSSIPGPFGLPRTLGDSNEGLTSSVEDLRPMEEPSLRHSQPMVEVGGAGENRTHV